MTAPELVDMTSPINDLIDATDNAVMVLQLIASLVERGGELDRAAVLSCCTEQARWLTAARGELAARLGHLGLECKPLDIDKIGNTGNDNGH